MQIKGRGGYIKGCAALAAAVLACLTGRGDVVETKDGSRLLGRISGIANNTVTLKTAYAGDIKIALGEVVGFATDDAVNARLADGKTVSGPVAPTEDKQVQIKSAEGAVPVKPQEVVDLWRSGEKDPRQRRWKFEAYADINGKQGNTNQHTTMFGAKATLEGPQDKLLFYASTDFADKDGTRTAQEIKGGADYTAFTTKHWGWFAREELLSDRLQNLKLRSTTAAGLSCFFWKTDRHSLEGRAGVGYRYEELEDGDTTNAPGLDFALKYFYKFSPGVVFKTDLGYLPAFNDFGVYLLTQDSGLEIPLGLSKYWTLRIGLANTYNSHPAPGIEQLDTTYYTRLQILWQ